MSRNILRKTVAGVVFAGAMSLAPLFSGATSADTNHIDIGDSQEYVVGESSELAGGNKAGRDFLVWQRHTITSASVGAGDLGDWQTNNGQIGEVAAPASPSDSEWQYVFVRRY